MREADKQTSCRQTRRDFLGTAGALSLSTLIPAVGISNPVRAATPNRGGYARFGLGPSSTSDSLDPAVLVGAPMFCVFHAIRNNLTEIGPEERLEPELAESWEPNEDATRWRFVLRQGVEFHNGKTLQADDVVASINHHRGDDTKSAGKNIVKQIQDVRPDGPRVVVVELESGNADLPYIFSAYQLGIMPAKDGQIDPHSAAGTGSYTLDYFEPGVRAQLSRNPNHWRNDRGFFDSIELIMMNDPVAQVQALLGGDIDVINRFDLKVVNRLKDTEEVEVDSATSTRHYTLPMNTTLTPFDNNDVRLALKYAIDREEILRKVWSGYGSIGNDHPITPANRYFANDVPQRGYDPDKAKFHLKKAGLTSLEVDLSASQAPFTGAVDLAILFSEHAKLAGMTINIVHEPEDGFWSNVWMKKPFVVSTWAGRPTEDWMFTAAYSSDSNYNDTYWKNERFDKLLVLARAELDQEKRRELYREMQLLIRNEGGVIVPVYGDVISARSTNIQHGGQISGALELDGAHAFERWWRAT